MFLKRVKTAPSIMQVEKVCFLSGREDGLQKHHIFGGIRRHASDEWGCWVWLNYNYHTGDYGIHRDAGKSLALKQDCQRKFEKLHSHEKFMEVFGKNYL